MASKTNNDKESNGANLGFEDKLWKAADKLRSNTDAAEYKHVVLGLLFLKYISDAFNEVHDELKNDPTSDPEDVDECISRRGRRTATVTGIFKATSQGVIFTFMERLHRLAGAVDLFDMQDGTQTFQAIMRDPSFEIMAGDWFTGTYRVTYSASFSETA